MDTATISYRVADFLKQHPPFQAMDDGDVLALPLNLQFGEWLGLAIVTALAAWLYATGSRRAQA